MEGRASFCLSETDMRDKPLLVRRKQALQMLGCGADYLYDRLNSGEIESFRDGGARWILLTSIEAYIAKRLAAANAERGRMKQRKNMEVAQK
jgi:hypothetical protein